MLHYRQTKGYKYLVAREHRVALPELASAHIEHPWFRLADGVLTINEGYAWDGASGPTIDTPATRTASLVHDVLYQAIRAGLLSTDNRATADWILYRLMRAAPGRGLWREIRAGYFWLAVRIFGAGSTKPRASEPQDLVHSAP